MRVRNQRGIVFPSPVVMLTVIAVAMAAVAFVATRGGEPAEREVAPAARQQPKASESPAADRKQRHQRAHAPKKQKKPKPAVKRGEVYVEVYNNSSVTGLAGSVAARATDIGWQVVGSDNWYGTIPATTVYYPASLKAAAKMLALDLGIQRTLPAVDPMRQDRLTVILTGPLG